MAAQASQAALAANEPGRQVRERPAGHISEDLLDDRVIAVLSSAWTSSNGEFGEDRVVAPDGKQLILVGAGLAVQVADPAEEQPRGDRLAFLRGESRVRHLGDPAVGHPGPQLVIPQGARVPDDQAS